MANYKATFILDTRGREESIDELIGSLKGELERAGAEVSQSNEIGRQDFARAADRRYVSGVYAQYQISGDADLPSNILETLRLNKLVSHKMIQRV
jgi:small subunit ribosomal protein S6